MYFYYRPSRQFPLGDAALDTSSATPTTDSTSTSWVLPIQDLITTATAKNWTKLAADTSTLLANKAVVTGAPTLIDSLKTIQTNLNKMTTNKVDASDTIQTTLATTLKIAQNEAAATPADRIMNEESLSKQIDSLVSAISDFKNENQGFIAIWNKITGREKSLFSPIQDQADGILNDIKTTPLTDQGRGRLLIQYNNAMQTATAAWSLIGGSTMIFLGYIFFEIFKGYASSAAQAGVSWGVGKAKERATKHVKKLHRKYISKAPKKKKKKKTKKEERNR